MYLEGRTKTTTNITTIGAQTKIPKGYLKIWRQICPSPSHESICGGYKYPITNFYPRR